MALQDPRPGGAFGHVCEIAATMGQLDALRDRWRARNDAPGLILLGWLEHAQGNDSEALALFLRAVELDAKSFAAKWSEARARAVLDKPGADDAARAAFALAGTDEQRYAALRVTANRLAAKGDAPAARAFLKTECAKASAQPGLRRLLIPDAAHAALADGTAEKWLAEFQQAHALGNAATGAEDTAAYAAACRALHEPARGLQAAREGLAKHPGDTTLLLLAAYCASDAGFITEAARDVLAWLGEHPGPGEQPSADDVMSALTPLVNMHAAHGVAELVHRHAAVLAECPTRWRDRLPELQTSGVLPALREALTAGLRDDDWERHVVLGEIAVLEHDEAAAADHFWAVLAAPMAPHPLATATLGNGNRGRANYISLPLEGTQLTTRLREVRAYYPNDALFDPKPEPMPWKIPTLSDARDYSIVNLHRLALRQDTEAAFVARLQKATAAWPLGEQLLAAATIADPGLMLDAIEKIAATPAQFSDRWLGFARHLLRQIQGLPWLDGELARRAQALTLPAVGPGKYLVISQRWSAPLSECFTQFAKGEIEKAGAAFAEAWPILRYEDVSEIESFYNALANTIDTLPANRQLAASRAALEWMAVETASRLDLPQAPDYSALRRTTRVPASWATMFNLPATRDRAVSWNSGDEPPAWPGGWLSAEQMRALLFRFGLQGRAGHVAFDPAETKLTGEARHVLQCYHLVLAGWHRDLTQARPLAEEVKKDRTDPAPAIFHFNLEKQTGPRIDGGDLRVKISPAELPPEGVIGQGARAVALSALALSANPPESELERLAAVPLTAEEQHLLVRRYGEENAADMVKRVRAWVPAAPAEGAPPEQFEAPDAPVLLPQLLLLADADRALTLAKDVLAAPVSSRDRAREPWGSDVAQLLLLPPIEPRVAAMRALRELGEFRARLTETEKEARAHLQDRDAAWRWLETALFVLGARDEVRTVTAPLERALIGDARTARGQALEWITSHFPDDLAAWELWAGTGSEEERAPARAALIKALQGPLAHAPLATRNRLLAWLPAKDRWAALEPAMRDRRQSPTEPEFNFWNSGLKGRDLFNFNLKAEAIQWWHHLLRGPLARDPALADCELEMLARASSMGDREIIAQMLADVIAAESRPVRGPLARGLLNDDQPDRLLRPLFEAAQRHGVADRVRELVAKEDPLGPGLVLLSRLLAGDAAAVDAVQKRIDDATLPPWPSQLCEELAGALADIPAGRPLAVRLLHQLEPFRAVSPPAIGVPRLAREGRIGTLAGATNAVDWTMSAATNYYLVPEPQREALMHDLLEGAARGKEAAFSYVAKLLANVYAREALDVAPLFEAMEDALHRGDKRMAGALAAAARTAKVFKDHGKAAEQKYEPHSRACALAAGDLRAGTPVVYCLPGAGDGADRETEVCWDFGWTANSLNAAAGAPVAVPEAGIPGLDPAPPPNFPGAIPPPPGEPVPELLGVPPPPPPLEINPSNAPDRQSVLSITGLTVPAAGGKATVELYGGRRADRLELIRRYENAVPSGHVTLKLPADLRYLAANIRTADGRAVFGAPRPVYRDAEPVPISEKLTAPQWYRREGGPAGERYAPATFAPDTPNAMPETVLGIYPLSEKSTLLFSTWMRRGELHFVCRDAAGKPVMDQTLTVPDLPGWKLHELRLSLNNATTAYILPREVVDVAISLRGDAEISGAWYAQLPAGK